MPGVAGRTRPEIHCPPCGRIHRMTPEAMAAVIRAFLSGDMQTVGPTIESFCITKVVDDEALRARHASATSSVLYDTVERDHHVRKAA